MFVSDWCITNLAGGFRSKALLAHYYRRKLFSQRSVVVAMCSDRRHPLLRNLNSNVTVDFVRVKSYANSLLGAINIQVAIVRQTINESFIADWYF